MEKSLQDCITQKIEILHAEDPKRPQNQNVAIAYAHCKSKMGVDSKDAVGSVKILNQVIANEGVLSYGGKRLLKKWDNLKTFVGKVVPVINEHPPRDNGNDGKISGKEKVYGTALLHACVKGEPVLCADFDMSNDAPIKNGYSLGYPFDYSAENGDLHGEIYDGVQLLTDIDHIALTDFPRNPIASRDGMDSKVLPILSTTSNPEVFKGAMGYDSFSTFVIKESHQVRDDIMPEKKIEDYQTEIDSLKKELAETKKSAGDSKAVEIDSRVKELEKEKTKFESDAKMFKERYEKEVASRLKTEIDSMVNETGIDQKAFDGKSPDFVDGAMMVHQYMSSKPASSIEKKTDVSGDAAVEMDSINSYKYNASTGKMEPVK